MKNPLAYLATLSSLILGMTAAQATAPTSELTVIGTLAIPSCTILAPNDGIYDIGKLSSSLIKPGTVTAHAAMTALTPMTKKWVVTCDADTYLNFTPVDNRDASRHLAYTDTFGLGHVNSTGKIGYYVVWMKNGTVDGKVSQFFSSDTGTFSPNSEVALYNNRVTGWASAANIQTVGKVFATDIMVSPYLAGTTDMNGPITDNTAIDGSMTMSFAFGI